MFPATEWKNAGITSFPSTERRKGIYCRGGLFLHGCALSEAGLALEEPGNDDPFNVMDSVKLIASDMDGTLLNGKGELDPAFFSLFEKLERRGIRFAAASGRQYDGLRRTFAPVADRMLFIAENGAYGGIRRGGMAGAGHGPGNGGADNRNGQEH